MTPFGRLSWLTMVVSIVMSFEIGGADAFLSRPHQLTTVTPIAQTRNSVVDRTSALRATDGGNIIPVTDSNYRELFGGEKPLLLDAYAVW